MLVRLHRWAATDACGLVILGVLAIVRGSSYIPPLVDPSRPPTHYMEMLLSPPAWAIVWITIGVVCLVAAFWRPLQPLAVGAVVGLHSMWALSFIFATILGDSTRGWVSSLGYIGIAAMTLYAYGRGQARQVTITDGR